MLPAHPAVPSKPAAARHVPASSNNPSHGLPAFLVRRMRRMKPRGSKIRAARTVGRTVPAGRFPRDAIAVPVVPMVSVEVTAVEEVTVRLAGAKVHVIRVGSVPQEKLTVPVNPPVGVSVITVVADESRWIVRADGFALSV